MITSLKMYQKHLYLKKLIKILITATFLIILNTISTPVYGTFHGNWCGLGNRLGLGGTALPPLDSLDAVCMHHDICITLHGSGNCTCDEIFLQELRRILLSQESHQAIKARAIYDMMSWVPCFGPSTISKPMSFFELLSRDMIFGNHLPIEIIPRILYIIAYSY